MLNTNTVNYFDKSMYDARYSNFKRGYMTLNSV